MSWVDFQLPTAYNVNSGTTYGLAIMGNVAINLVEVTGTGQRDHNAVSSYANGFSNPFGIIWGTDNTGAISIYAEVTGSTQTATPTPTNTATPTPSPTPSPSPTPTPTSAPLSGYSGTNSAPISASSNAWSVYSVYPTPNNINNVLDYSNTFGDQPSILSEPALGTTDKTREIDSIWIPISPGEHIVWSVYMMSGSSGGQRQTGTDAAQIGWDYYGTNGRICGNLDVSADYEPYSIGWNTGWTQVTYDLTIPTSVTADGTTGGYYAGQQVMPTGVILWLQPEYCDSGLVWFAGSTLYINPS